MPDLPLAPSWVEEITFAECPHCRSTADLGPGPAAGNVLDVYHCPRRACAKPFRIESDPPDDPFAANGLG